VGVTLAWDDWFIHQTKDLRFQEILDLLFNLTYFVLFGIHFPWSEFERDSFAPLAVLAFAIVFLKRIVQVLLLRKFIPEIKTLQEAVFVGWFGPTGVGALFYALQAQQHLHSSLIYSTVCSIVLTSVFVHGITVPFFHLSLVRFSSNNSVVYERL
jgi:NhaP-type Na+/H+ or K+/H+ antiporter